MVQSRISAQKWLGSVYAIINTYESKKEGKYQGSIQSSTTRHPGYQWESDNFIMRHRKREPRGQPWHEMSNNVVCATSKGSDQPTHTRSLIRAFASRLNILWLLRYWPNIIWSF